MPCFSLHNKNSCMEFVDHMSLRNNNVNALYNLFNDLIYWSNHAINDINQLREENQHRINDIQQLRESDQHRINEITALQAQNKNQADIITILINNSNQQAIEIAVLNDKDTQLTRDFNTPKHIDCNIEVIGAVEPGTDGLNQII